MDKIKDEYLFKFPIKKIHNIFLESFPYYYLFFFETITHTSFYFFDNPFIFYFVYWGLVPIFDIFIDYTIYNYSPEDNKRLKKANNLFLIPLYLALIPDFIFSFYVLSQCVNPEKTLIYKLILIFGYSEAQSYHREITHNLNHYSDYFNKILSYLYLSKIFYSHYLLEHNKGHHLNTASELDPHFARKDTTIYQTLYKSLKQEYFSAWKIGYDNSESKKLIDNENFRIHLLYLGFIIFYWSYYGIQVFPFIFINHAFFSVQNVLVNYLTHYGLERKEINPGDFELQTIRFSWNFEEGLARFLFLNANRHSDHHLNPMKPYQCLHIYENSPFIPFESSYSMSEILLDPNGFCKAMNKVIETFGTEEERKRKEENQEYSLFYRKIYGFVYFILFFGIYFGYFYLF